MSYYVTFQDGESILISDERAGQLKELKLAKYPPKDVEIDGDVYQLSQIVKIKKKPVDPLVELNPSFLLEDGRCKGRESIQKEINDIIKKQFPDNRWGVKIQDDRFREAIRKKLRADNPDRKWCDYRANECACEPNSL